MEFLYKITPDQMPETAHDFLKSSPYGEIDLIEDENALIQWVLSGVPVLLIDGYDKLLSIDFRSYPARGVDEPEKDRVMRGSKDGFVETVVFNTALIRRRIRSTELVMEMHTVGKVPAPTLSLPIWATGSKRKCWMTSETALTALTLTP